MTNDASPTTRILGSLRSADGVGVVRIEDRYDTGIDDLWSAITEPGRLARWFGELDGEPSPEGAFTVRIPDAGVRNGRVEACEPPQHLLLTMRDPERRAGQPEQTQVEARLTADGEQTVLVVEVTGVPLELIPFYGVGWQIHAENLAAHVAGAGPGGDLEARWDELLPSYQELAARIG
jgi:uncharacterized protein YndB with AHSA1/START domain